MSSGGDRSAAIAVSRRSRFRGERGFAASVDYGEWVSLPHAFSLLHRQVGTNRVDRGQRMKRRVNTGESGRLIDECDMLHRNRFGFPVHQDLVPSVKDDCLVIWMTHTPSNEHRWVSSLRQPS